MTEPEKKYIVIVEGETNASLLPAHRFTWLDTKAALLPFQPLIDAITKFNERKKDWRESLDEYQREYVEASKINPDVEWHQPDDVPNPGNYNWQNPDPLDGALYPYPYIDPDLIQEFEDEFVPYDDYGIHTINSIQILEVTDVKDIL